MRTTKGSSYRVINLRQEIADAWNRAWKRNLESRVAGRDYGGDTYYLTATAIEREMRDEFGRRLNRCSFRVLGLGGRPLLSHVRDWLFAMTRAGEFEMDTRGKGHCSSARFRPAGSPASPAEKKVDELPKKERDRRRFVVHLTVEDRPKYGSPPRACAGKPKKKKRPSFSRPRHRSYPVRDPERVTCKKCLKILERDFVRVVVFGEEKPLLARVLARGADGVELAVDSTGTLRAAADFEFLPALAGRSAEIAAEG